MATPTFFDGWLSDIQNEALMRPITKEGLLNTLHSFQAGESLGPDGWTVEFYGVSGTLLSKTFLR
jgi:hypothetical protein